MRGTGRFNFAQGLVAFPTGRGRRLVRNAKPGSEGITRWNVSSVGFISHRSDDAIAFCQSCFRESASKVLQLRNLMLGCPQMNSMNRAQPKVVVVGAYNADLRVSCETPLVPGKSITGGPL